MPFLELHGVAKDEMIDLPLTRLLVLDHDTGAQSHAVLGDLRHVDRRQLAQTLPQMTKARLNELLPLERCLVLAVLAQVAVLHRFPDLVRHRDVELVLQSLDFLAKLAFELFDHLTPPRTQKMAAPGWSAGRVRVPAALYLFPRNASRPRILP